MAVKTLKSKKRNSKRDSVNLTTEVLKRAVKSGSLNLEKDAMDLMGYTVIEENGWVIRKYRNGKTTKVSKLVKSKRPKKLVLD